MTNSDNSVKNLRTLSAFVILVWKEAGHPSALNSGCYVDCTTIKKPILVVKRFGKLMLWRHLNFGHLQVTRGKADMSGSRRNI